MQFVDFRNLSISSSRSSLPRALPTHRPPPDLVHALVGPVICLAANLRLVPAGFGGGPTAARRPPPLRVAVAQMARCSAGRSSPLPPAAISLQAQAMKKLGRTPLLHLHPPTAGTHDPVAAAATIPPHLQKGRTKATLPPFLSLLRRDLSPRLKPPSKRKGTKVGDAIG